MKSMTGTMHGGDIHTYIRKQKVDSDQLIDFSANINPLGPPEWMRSVINREIENIIHYPDPECFELRKQVAEVYDVSESQVIAANGTTELLYLLPSIFPGRRIVLPVPCYVDYINIFKENGYEVSFFPLQQEKNFALDVDKLYEELKGGELVIIGSPNNPTGSIISFSQILNLSEKCRDTTFIIDEAFLDFVDGSKSVAGQAENIITLHSMTKFYGIPGLRLGFGIFPVSIASQIKKRLPPWTVNHLAQKIGIQCLRDGDFQSKSRLKIKILRDQFVKQLNQLPQLQIFPSSANYLLIRLISGKKADELFEILIRKNILIRVCDNYKGLDNSYFRIAVRTAEENDRFINSIMSAFNVQRKIPSATRRKKAKSIMFQGTSSNAGKSILCASLCRILLQEGVRVAPFKAQNMSLNSFVTIDGLEMGRAQVVQAQAARLDPDVRMNPVLLKPNSDTGSQVIVKGKPVGNMTVTAYHSFKKEAIKSARQSYEELSQEYDIIVLEGAGSPGEVNLRENDFVNMEMAKFANAPVLLVGDIDRGGVYASFIGTMGVLTEMERKSVAGFVVNRFRGLADLLDPAHRYVTEYTGKKVLGVVPYIDNLGLPEEDSVSFKSGLFNSQKPDCEHIDVVLINTPHISNFTDVEPFLDEPDIHLRVVSDGKEIGKPDVIILPGSKNVIGDLKMLRDKGLDKVILSNAESGCEIVGICGGYQILGTEINDPYGIESTFATITGLSLLNMKTTLDSDKTLKRKQGIHNLSGLPVHGYEIHHGLSHSNHHHLIEFDDHSKCGSSTENGMIWGAYLHGLFDSDEFRRWFIDRVRTRKGLRPVGSIVNCYDLEPAFDRLANTVRDHMDMDKIFKLINL